MKILLVDDHPVVRRGIAQLLDEEADMEVCGEAESVEAALEVMGKTNPDVTLVDLSLRGADGFELIAAMREDYPKVIPLVLSMHAEISYVERALRAGAKGYVTKNEADETIIGAIRKVYDGGLYIEERMNEEVLKRLVSAPEKDLKDRIGDLSEREHAVFELMGSGKDTREIAHVLGLNMKTVETYRRRIKAKLEIDSMSKLAYTAFEYFSQQEPR